MARSDGAGILLQKEVISFNHTENRKPSEDHSKEGFLLSMEIGYR